MTDNWGYLITNNFDYWIPHLYKSCEAIRHKLEVLPHANWRQFHPRHDEPNGFLIFAFIDNTMFAFCRPGGNTSEGESSP